MATTQVTPIVLELGFTPPPVGTPNCGTCPNALTSSELNTAVGKAVASPVCAIKMLPLIRPDQSTKVRSRAVTTISDGCKEYGKPRPEFDPAAIQAPIMYGPVGIGMPHPGVEGQVVSNCTACSNYVPPQTVASATGWNAGLCTAKGKLLMPDRLRAYATGCKDSRGINDKGRAKIESFMFFPEYTKKFGEIDRSALAKKSRSIEPLDWPTDKPVSIADTVRGIKAWRRIDDPEGEGASTYIPVYRPDKFDALQLQNIPRTGDKEHPEIYHDHGGFVYKMAVMMMELDLTPAAWGPPGVGKTELGRHLAWLMQLPFTRISINGSSEVDDLVGKMMLLGGETKFQFGRIPKAWSQPGVILLDEPNVGPPEIWQFLRPLTDNSRQLVVDMSAGERIDRHPDCWFFMAMNPAWSPLNVGTNTIGDADARRLLHLYMDLPPEPVEREIITDWCQALDSYNPAGHLDNIMKIAADLRPMCDDGTLPLTWGLANQIKVARLLRWFSPIEAYKVAVLNYLSPSTAQQVVQVINSYYPT